MYMFCCTRPASACKMTGYTLASRRREDVPWLLLIIQYRTPLQNNRHFSFLYYTQLYCGWCTYWLYYHAMILLLVLSLVSLINREINVYLQQQYSWLRWLTVDQERTHDTPNFNIFYYKQKDRFCWYLTYNHDYIAELRWRDDRNSLPSSKSWNGDRWY